MKKLILTIAIILMATVGHAAVGDITQAEVRPDVASYQLDTVKFLVITRTCVVTYRKVDSDGDSVGGEIQILFMDITDDPDTVEDETDTSFTDLIAAINAGNSIKTTIKNAAKLKLGL